MSDIIRLLPDGLANQIAAGEVVQRPASVVKELMENSIDAGADNITLNIKDGGKLLIMITDNGKGMSPTDARLSFERHATSKITKAADLFNIRTMGFRGEALASIAAVAQVEMITRRAEDPMGTRIRIEGSVMVSQEPVQASPGTIISVKNIFFNIPARRNFLKSIEVEKKHCFEEFIRLALAHPDRRFTLIHNDENIHILLPGKIRQRIAALFRTETISHLLDLNESAGDVMISGVVGTPELAKKSRGDQYLFVNERFIRSPLMNHAIQSAYDRMIPEGQFAFYVLFITCPPASIDVNVHPSKQEIKFEDDQLIYTYLKSAAKHALAVNLVAPALDFERDAEMNQAWNADRNQPTGSTTRDQYRIPGNFYKENAGRWKDLYENISLGSTPEINTGKPQTLVFKSSINEHDTSPVAENIYEAGGEELFQLHGRYIVCQVKSGMMIIDQYFAHQRILYDEFMSNVGTGNSASQMVMFPVTLKCTTHQTIILAENIPVLKSLGFEVRHDGKGVFTFSGFPAFIQRDTEMDDWLHEIINDLEMDVEVKSNMDSFLARSYASKFATPRGRKLSQPELRELIDRLFATSFPSHNANGDKCFTIISFNELTKMLS